MRHFPVISMLLLAMAAAVRAQIPAERPMTTPGEVQPPGAAAAGPPPLSHWPDAKAVKPHAWLLVSTFDALNPHVCVLRSLDAYHIVCEGPGRGLPWLRGVGAEYDRPIVESIQVAPRGYGALSATKKLTLQGGGVLTAVGLFAGLDGGYVYVTPTAVGLSMIAAGVVMHIAQVHNRHKDPVMLYKADVAQHAEVPVMPVAPSSAVVMAEPEVAAPTFAVAIAKPESQQDCMETISDGVF